MSNGIRQYSFFHFFFFLVLIISFVRKFFIFSRMTTPMKLLDPFYTISCILVKTTIIQRN